MNEVRARKIRRHRSRTIRTFAVVIAAGIISGSVAYGVQSASAATDPSMMNTALSGTFTSADFSDYAVGEHEGSVAQVAQSALGSLVTLSCTSVTEMRNYFGGAGQQQQVSSAGSGVIIGKSDSELYIATNNHVIDNADTVSAGFVNETAAEAYVKGADPSTDLAVVAVPIANLEGDTLNEITIATIGRSSDLVLGDQVVAIGNALGIGQSVTSGYISAFGRSLNLSNEDGDAFVSDGLIQTDASINSGNSGGGLFNMKGELIAINEAKTSTTQSGVNVDNMGFAIPMDKATPILQSMIDGTAISNEDSSNGAYLGVTVSEIDEQAQAMYNMPAGVYVSEVEDGSPAQAGGLLAGDIITAIGDSAVTSYDEMTAALAARNPGEQVQITICRSNNGVYQQAALNVTLGSK